MSKYEKVQQQTETLNVTTAQPLKSFFVTGYLIVNGILGLFPG